MGEMYCRLFSSLYNLETVSLRYFNVFGPKQDPESDYAAVIPRFATAALSDGVPTIFGDGEQTRDFVYVEDVASANMLASRAADASGGVFNIGSRASHSLNQLISILGTISGRRIQACMADPRPGDIRHSSADVSRAADVLGYHPKISFEDGLRRYMRWLAVGSKAPK